MDSHEVPSTGQALPRLQDGYEVEKCIGPCTPVAVSATGQVSVWTDINNSVWYTFSVPRYCWSSVQPKLEPKLLPKYFLCICLISSLYCLLLEDKAHALYSMVLSMELDTLWVIQWILLDWLKTKLDDPWVLFSFAEFLSLSQILIQPYASKLWWTTKILTNSFVLVFQGLSYSIDLTKLMCALLQIGKQQQTKAIHLLSTYRHRWSVKTSWLDLVIGEQPSF